MKLVKEDASLFSKIVVYFFIVIISIGLPTLFVLGIVKCVRYDRYLESPVYVDAVVTEIRVEEDSEDGCRYVSYVSYTLDGVTYDSVRHEIDHQIADLAPVGTQLQLIVDPDDPGMLMKNGINTFGCMSVGVLLCIFSAGSLRDLRHDRLSVGLRGKPETEELEKDMHIIIRAKMGRVLWLLLTVLFVSYRLAFPRLFGVGYLFAAAVTFVFWLIGMANAICATYKVRHGQYTVQWDRLVDKKRSYDSEGDDTYTLFYQSHNRRWETSVTWDEYEKATVGDLALTAYLKGNSQPILHYNSRGSAKG